VSSRDRAHQPPDWRAHWERNQRLEFSRSGLATASSGLHTLSANPIGSIRRRLSQLTPSPSDIHWACALCPSEHPSARRMTVDLVQAGHLHRRSTLRLALPRGSAWKHRQDASNPLLQPTFRVTSTRRNTTFGDLSTAAGEPAGSTFEDLSWPRRFRRSVEKDAGPPFGHPASDGRAIDGARSASVCSALSRERSLSREGREPPQPCRLSDGSAGQTSDTRSKSRRGRPKPRQMPLM